MTEKELKKLSRYQLLEMIIIQSRQLELKELHIQSLQDELDSQKIRLSSAGNIAEAALQLSGIFEAAQSAADLYIKNLEEQSAHSVETEEAARLKAEQILADARQQAENMQKEAKEQANTMLYSAARRSNEMLEQTQKKCQEIEKTAELHLARIQKSNPG